jgi:hypothetical protein
MTFSSGTDLADLRTALGLRPMSEFNPAAPARVYDYRDETFFKWDPELAAHYRRWAGPHRDRAYDELTDYDGLELLGWLPAG